MLIKEYYFSIFPRGYGPTCFILYESIQMGTVPIYISDKFFLTVRNIETITTFQAIIFGLAQVISIIPGTSRSGIIITFARFFGYKRTDSAKFAMLLSIPAIILPLFIN